LSGQTIAFAFPAIDKTEMDSLTAAAASGIRARMESLDMIANNLANASAAGFKSDSESYGLYLSGEADDSPDGTTPAILPVIQNRWTDFSQGTLIPTGNSMDLALNGKGFFAASTSNATLYTRGGSFHVAPSGQLQTREGYAVQGTDGKPILLDNSKTFDVSADGTILQDGQQVGQIAVLDFQDTTVLTKRGANYFRSSVPGAAALPAANSEIQQGKIEGGNSESAHSAARLVTILRQFEGLQKAMAIAADMNRHAVEDVAKVSP
jgi:flagellar basal-body rod protein FlgF